MGVKLQKYTRQVGVQPGFAGTEGSLEAAGAPWAAIGREADVVGGIAGGVAEQRNKLNIALEAKKRETESKLLKMDLKNKIGVAKNSYTSGLEIRKDYSNFGTQDDGGLSDFNKSVGEILSDERLQRYPELAEELKIFSGGEIANSQIDASTLGVRELHKQTKAVFDTSYDLAIQRGDADDAMFVIDESPVHTDAEKTEMKLKVPQLIDHAEMTRQVFTDPAKLMEDLKPDSGMYTNLTPEDRKSGRAYARQILSERQQVAMDELYAPKSEYQDMPPKDRQSFIDDKLVRGEISPKAHKSETERIKAPKMVDIQPQDNRDYLAFQNRLFAAAGTPDEQTKILNEITASGMPMSMRTQLYGLQRDIASPTGKTKTASYQYARETMSAVFGREEIVPGVAHAWNIFAERPKGFTEESRDDLVYRAHAEAQSELLEWMRSTPDFNEAQISAKVYDIVGQKSKEYGMSQIPVRLGEQIVAPVAQPEEEEEVEGEDIDEITRIQSVIDEVEVEMPDATDDEKRTEITKRLSR